MKAKFKVWQGTEGGWRWSLESEKAQLAIGPNPGRASYEEAVQETSEVAVASLDAAKAWLLQHGRV